MANNIQKKIAVALSSKRNRKSNPPETLLHESEFAALIPSLDDLQVSVADYQQAGPPKLHELFEVIINRLKGSYFNHDLNQTELEETLAILHEQCSAVTDPNEQKLFLNDYFTKHGAKLSLHFINSQLEIAIRFSKLAICVLGRQIKEALGVTPNAIDEEIITKLLGELSEMVPSIQDACLTWLYEQVQSYQPDKIESYFIADNDILQDPDAIKEQTIIELNQHKKNFNQHLLQYYANTELYDSLQPAQLSKKAIRQAYRRLHNKLASDLQLREASQHKGLQQFIAEIINQRIYDIGQSTLFSLENIKKICDKQLKEQTSIILLCQIIIKQRATIESYITKLNELPTTEDITHLLHFFMKKIKSPLFQKIEKTLTRIIEQERYGSYKSFTVDLIGYTKALVLLPIYDSSIMLQISVIQPSLVRPLSKTDLIQMQNCVKSLNHYTSNNAIKRECSYLLHTLTYNEELAIHLQSLEALIFADFSEIIHYLLNPFYNSELSQFILSNRLDLVISPQLIDILTRQGIDDLKRNLLQYQKNLHALGKMRLVTIQQPDNNEANSQIKQHYNIINIIYAKLDVINEMFNLIENLETNDLTQELQELIDSSKRHVDSMRDYYAFLSNTAQEFGHLKIDANEIFLQRLIRGDFFNMRDHDLLQSATYAMLYSLSPTSIFDGLIENFDTYSEEQKKETLHFIENYLSADSHQMLFSAIQPEKSAFYSQLTAFHNLAKQAQLATDNLNRLIKENIAIKQQRFSKLITALNEGSFTKEQLIRRIRTLCNKLATNSFHLNKLDEYIVEIANIFNSPTFVNFTSREQSELQANFDELTHLCNSLPYYRQAFSKLQKNLSYLISRKNLNVVGKSANFYSDTNIQNNLFMLIENSFNEINNSELYNKILKKFITNIENELAIVFTEIDIFELRELNWLNDENRLSEGLNPNAPNIHRYQESITMILYFLRLSIFYSQSLSDPTPVINNMQKIKNIVYFYEKAFAKALEIKAFTTASILYKALQIPDIQRLGYSDKINKMLYQRHFGKTQRVQLHLANHFREENVLPLLSFIQHKLLFVYKRSYGSQFERLGNIGRTLQEFIYKKDAIKKNLVNTENNTLQQMTMFVASLGLLTADTWKIDHEKSDQLLTQASYDVKPDTSKKYQLDEFKTINSFMKHLVYCLSRSIGHQLSDHNPEKAIFDWMVALIKQDTRLLTFSDSLEVLYLLDDIAHTHKSVYKKFNTDLIAILTLYYQKISKFIKAENEEHKSSLDNFYNQFNKNKRIRNIKTSDDNAFDLFSHMHKLKEIVKKIDDKYAQYQRVQVQLEKHKSQQAYSQLLDDILSGATTRTLPLATDSEQTQTRGAETLLPDNEYDIPSAEPEHPDRIGINRTMSFNETVQSSILALFNTDELKMEFLAAFPWALQFDNIEALKEAHFDSNINLLGTPQLFSNELQLSIMKFVLLAMDALGKIAGFSGELTIQNFDRISEVINQLKWISAAIQQSNVNEQQLLVEVEAAVHEMSFRNNEYFEMQQLYNPPITVESNPNMNGFCHINEHLAYQLTGFSYDGSLLAPNVPSSPYFEKISEVLEGG